MKTDILIVGVGGQGTLLASRILGKFAFLKGLDVKLSEVHGMSQRGGSVVTHVKMADKVNSPIVARGEADVILSFEKLEAARYLDFLKEGGIVVTNVQEILPMPVITGAKEYPSDCLENIKKAGIKVVEKDALSLAEKAGSSKAVNVVMLGALTKYLGLDKAAMLEALKATVPAKFLEMNLKAFEYGYTE